MESTRNIGEWRSTVTPNRIGQIAIPAAMFAHYFEGRIQSLFHHIDELLFNLMPQIERYEGRMRFGRPAGDGEPAVNGAAEPSAPPVEAR